MNSPAGVGLESQGEVEREGAPGVASSPREKVGADLLQAYPPLPGSETWEYRASGVFAPPPGKST